MEKCAVCLKLKVTPPVRDPRLWPLILDQWFRCEVRLIEICYFSVTFLKGAKELALIQDHHSNWWQAHCCFLKRTCNGIYGRHLVVTIASGYQTNDFWLLLIYFVDFKNSEFFILRNRYWIVSKWCKVAIGPQFMLLNYIIISTEQMVKKLHLIWILFR